MFENSNYLYLYLFYVWTVHECVVVLFSPVCFNVYRYTYTDRFLLLTYKSDRKNYFVSDTSQKKKKKTGRRTTIYKTGGEKNLTCVC